MNNILLLTKVFLKNSIFKKANTKKDEHSNRKITRIIGYIILIAYVVAVYGILSYQVIDMLNQVNQTALFIGGLLLSIAVLILIQAIVSGMNLFYFSKDVENILPFPIKPYQIISAKFNVLLITEYFIVFLFAIAPFIIYGILTGASFLFYIYGLLVLLIFPVFPAIISSILVMIIMSFSKLIKNKEKMQLIATMATIFLVLGIQFAFTGEGDLQTEQVVEMLTKANGLVDAIDKYFPTLNPAVNCLINYDNLEGTISFIKILGTTAISYFIFILTARKIYLKGVVGATSSGKNTKKRKKHEIVFKQKTVGIRYVKKEIILLLKNPIYFMQCVMPAIIMPLFFVVIFMTNKNELIGISMMDINNTIGLSIILAIISFLLSMIFVPVTAISRDGKNAIFMKYIPISYYKQIRYKMMPSIMLSMLLVIIIVSALKYAFNVTYIMMISVILNSLIISIIYSYLMIIVDLKRPKLSWDTEYAVVKQNFNMVFGFAFSVAYMLIFTAFALFMGDKNLVFVSCMIFVINSIILFSLDRYVRLNQHKLLKNIE